MVGNFAYLDAFYLIIVSCTSLSTSLCAFMNLILLSTKKRAFIGGNNLVMCSTIATRGFPLNSDS